MLIKNNFNKKFIESIYQAIVCHDSEKRHLIKTLEGKIIYDADKLQITGPIGILREFGDMLIKGFKVQRAWPNLITYIKKHNKHYYYTKTARQLQKELIIFNFEFLRIYQKYQKT